MAWEARSFLCVCPDAVLTRRVQAIAGFSWGFTISHGSYVAAPAALGSESVEQPPQSPQNQLSQLEL